jgi:hypothetical protein
VTTKPFRAEQLGELVHSARPAVASPAKGPPSLTREPVIRRYEPNFARALLKLLGSAHEAFDRDSDHARQPMPLGSTAPSETAGT